nr:vWA domain-containing protein [Pelagicoccus albus]
MAFAFARPFFPTSDAPPASAASNVSRVFLIDQSASMSQPGIRELLNGRIAEELESISPTDRLSVVGFSDTSQILISSSEWSSWPPSQRKELALAKLEQIPTTDYPTHLDTAVEAGLNALAQLNESSEEKGIGEIVIFSDFAQGSRISGLTGLEWPSETFLKRVSLEAPGQDDNLTLQWGAWQEEENLVSATLSVLTQTADSQALEFSVQAYRADSKQPLGDELQAFIPANKTSVSISIPLPKEAKTWPLLFELSGDTATFDNQLFRAPKNVPIAEVTLLSDAPISDTREAPYFVSKALQGIDFPQIRLQESLEQSSDLILVEAELSEQNVEQLKDKIRTGATAFVLAKDPNMSATLQALLEAPEIAIQAATEGELRIGDVDFEHPLFSIFSDPRYSNFAQIKSWQTPRISYPDTLDYETIASLDDQSPLLIETSLGTGKVYIWSGSWSPEKTQWTLSSKFVPFLHQLALSSIGGLPLPENSTLSSRSRSSYSNVLSSLPEAAGVYQSDESFWYAFQMDPNESLTVPISEDDWDKLGLPDYDSEQIAQVTRSIQESANRENASILEERQSLWRWMLWIVLALLALESLVAIKSTRQEGGTPA